MVSFLRLALNALDGLVARDLGPARPWGEVLNEVSDRLADLALFVGAALDGGWGDPVDPSDKTALSVHEHWEVTRRWKGVIRSLKQEAQR